MEYFYNLAKEEELKEKNVNLTSSNSIFTKLKNKLQRKNHTSKLSHSEKIKRLKITAIIFSILLLICIILYFLFIKPAYKLYQDSLVAYQSAQNLRSEFQNKNLTSFKNELKTLKSNLLQIETDYQEIRILASMPILKKYYSDGESAIKAGKHGLLAAELLVEGLEPFSDLIGFKSEFVNNIDMTADEKLAEIAEVMPQLLPSFDAAIEEIDSVEKYIDEINPEDYPEDFRGISVQNQISEIKKITTDAKKVAHDIRPILEKLPSAMGEPDPVNYLILFQNDKELRPTGGFMTAYAIVSMNHGRFEIIKSEDIYNIDQDQTYSEIETPEAIKRYLVPALYMRDSNFSPDFKKSMETFEIYWENSVNLPEIEGIIGIDTEFVRSFMEVTGSIYLENYGETFEADNIVYELELYSEKILSGTTRKDFLGDLMSAMVDKVFGSKSNEWRDLLDKGFEEISRKHMLLYFHDETLQQFAEEYNFAGRIVDFDGDYLHISDANLGGLKSDYWVEREFSQKINIAEDGTVMKELSITYHNRGQFDGWLNAQTRTYTRVYVPLGSELISSEGGDYGSSAEVSEELGKTVFANFTRTSPMSSQTLKFTYKLPFKIVGTGLFSNKNYQLMMQKQAGLGKPQPDLSYQQFSIEINNEKKLEGDFLKDETFSWDL